MVTGKGSEGGKNTNLGKGKAKRNRFSSWHKGCGGHGCPSS